MSNVVIRDNMKYTKKIKSFLFNRESSIMLDSISYNNNAIKKIYESAKQAVTKKHDIKVIESSLLKPVHDKDQYPLSYIFFKSLKELNFIDDILPLTPNISDFRTFVNWHRENIEFINFDKVHNLMKNLDDKSDSLEIKNLINVYKSIHKTSGHRKILHDALYENTFISWDVQHDLESCTLKYTKYMVNNKHIVGMFVPIIDAENQQNNVNHPDIKIIATLIDMMENLVKSDRGGMALSVNLLALFSNQKKNVYPKTKVLCCDNINSGSTYPGKNIVCWRREEFYKVLIHELFHYHSFDFFSSSRYYKDLENMIMIPAIHGNDMLNEAYTETSTIIILSIIQYINNMHLADGYISDKHLVEHMNQFIKREILFILYQIAKIFFIFGCEDVDLYINNKIIIHKNTSFRSYFIIKMILLSNINATLQLMNQGITLNGGRLIEYRH